MRHRNAKATLNRPADQRRAMVRNLMTSLFAEGALTTTGARANTLAAEGEKMVTLLKRSLEKKEEFNAIRDAKKVLFTEEAQRAAVDYAKKTDKTSGFTRITKIGYRDGDGALQVQIELIAPTK